MFQLRNRYTNGYRSLHLPAEGLHKVNVNGVARTSLTRCFRHFLVNDFFELLGRTSKAFHGILRGHRVQGRIMILGGRPHFLPRRRFLLTTSTLYGIRVRLVRVVHTTVELLRRVRQTRSH